MSQAEVMELVHDVEGQLWNEFIILEARYRETWLLSMESWRKLVLVNLAWGSPENEAHKQVNALVSELRREADAAYEAWKVVAYPLHNIPLNDPKSSS